MNSLPRSRVVFLLLLMVSVRAQVRSTPNGLTSSADNANSAEKTVISNLDLSGPFATRKPWRFVATQGPLAVGASGSGADEPGEIQLCLRATPSDPCDPRLQSAPANYDSPPHYLAAEILYPRGRAVKPLLFVQTHSVHGGNGSQLVFTQMLAYENTQDRFVRIYQYATGTNGNQEVRFIGSGRLQGDIISVDPTENAPYGYWVTVNVLTQQYTYKTALRYRSATRYGDGNPLAVIDSEMPNIEQRLGYWKSGMALPVPTVNCLKPRLIRMELWCN